MSIIQQKLNVSPLWCEVNYCYTVYTNSHGHIVGCIFVSVVAFIIIIKSIDKDNKEKQHAKQLNGEGQQGMLCTNSCPTHYTAHRK